MQAFFGSLAVLGVIVLAVSIAHKYFYLPRKREAQETARRKREKLKVQSGYIPRAADTAAVQRVYDPTILSRSRVPYYPRAVKMLAR